MNCQKPRGNSANYIVIVSNDFAFDLGTSQTSQLTSCTLLAKTPTTKACPAQIFNGLVFNN